MIDVFNMQQITLHFDEIKKDPQRASNIKSFKK